MRRSKTNWQSVLDGARTTLPNVYSSTFFAKRFISIIDQQTRAFNLSLALHKSGKVLKHSHVAIVGGGVSGMTCAVALAMLADCIICVFERDRRVLRQLRDAGFRYIHPNLNPHGSLSSLYPNQKTNFALMNWSGNFAPSVAEELGRKFDHYRQASCIALRCSCAVEDIETGPNNSVVLKVDAPDRLQQVYFDTVIVASGFGKERDNTFSNDVSYWHSGNPQYYRPIGRSLVDRKERILISGNGDSGVVELAHFLVQDFSHDQIFGLLPVSDYRAGRRYDAAVEALEFRKIEEGDSNYPELSGPVGWYRRRQEILKENRGIDLFKRRTLAGRLMEKIYYSIDELLGEHAWSEALDAALVDRVEQTIDHLLDELASFEIRRLVKTVPLEKIFRARFRKQFHVEFDVTILGRNSKIYSRRQAPLNWFLLRVLEYYGNYKYLQATLTKAARTNAGIEAVLERSGGEVRETYDRVVVRHGPDYSAAGYQKLKPYMPTSQYTHTETHVLGSVAATTSHPSISSFRTNRWKQAVRAGATLQDQADLEMPNSSNDIDALFFAAYQRVDGVPRGLGEVYRKAKKKKDFQTGTAELISQLGGLVASK